MNIEDNQSEISKLLSQSFRMQKMLFNGMGIVTAVTGIGLLILTFVMPVQPGEENIVRGLQVTSIIFVGFAFWARWYVDMRIRKIKILLFVNPDRVKKIIPFSVQKRGVIAYAIRIISQDNSMIGINVIGPKTQTRILELLTEELPNAEVQLR